MLKPLAFRHTELPVNASHLLEADLGSEVTQRSDGQSGRGVRLEQLLGVQVLEPDLLVTDFGFAAASTGVEHQVQGVLRAQTEVIEGNRAVRGECHTLRLRLGLNDLEHIGEDRAPFALGGCGVNTSGHAGDGSVAAQPGEHLVNRGPRTQLQQAFGGECLSCGQGLEVVLYGLGDGGLNAGGLDRGRDDFEHVEPLVRKFSIFSDD